MIGNSRGEGSALSRDALGTDLARTRRELIAGVYGLEPSEASPGRGRLRVAAWYAIGMRVQ